MKTAISFEDMCSALEEFGIVMRRPPFVEDKMNQGSGFSMGTSGGNRPRR